MSQNPPSLVDHYAESTEKVIPYDSLFEVLLELNMIPEEAKNEPGYLLQRGIYKNFMVRIEKDRYEAFFNETLSKIMKSAYNQLPFYPID